MSGGVLADWSIGLCFLLGVANEFSQLIHPCHIKSTFPFDLLEIPRAHTSQAKKKFETVWTSTSRLLMKAENEPVRLALRTTPWVAQNGP